MLQPNVAVLPWVITYSRVARDLAANLPKAYYGTSNLQQVRRQSD